MKKTSEKRFSSAHCSSFSLRCVYSSQGKTRWRECFVVAPRDVSLVKYLKAKFSAHTFIPVMAPTALPRLLSVILYLIQSGTKIVWCCRQRGLHTEVELGRFGPDSISFFRNLTDLQSMGPSTLQGKCFIQESKVVISFCCIFWLSVVCPLGLVV